MTLRSSLDARRADAELGGISQRLPFEPPPPEKPSAAETAGTIAAGVGIMALAIVVEPLLRLASIPFAFMKPTFDEDEQPPFDLERALVDSGATATQAPERDERGFVECTRCSAFVPYASMSLNEDGNFCRICAERMTTNAIADLPDDAYKL